MAVADIHAARGDLFGCELTTVSEVDVQPWGSFVFSDLDGNKCPAAAAENAAALGGSGAPNEGCIG